MVGRVAVDHQLGAERRAGAIVALGPDAVAVAVLIAALPDDDRLALRVDAGGRVGLVAGGVTVDLELGTDGTLRAGGRAGEGHGERDDGGLPPHAKSGHHPFERRAYKSVNLAPAELPPRAPIGAWGDRPVRLIRPNRSGP